jgi:cell pole-organizing protein PopZ
MQRAVGPESLDVKVEDLLANIRKSVDSDIDSLSGGTTSQSRGTLMRGALREMRVSMGVEPASKKADIDDVANLRERIKQKMQAMELDSFAEAAKTAPPKVQTAVVPARGDFSGIMAGESRQNGLRPSYAERDRDDDVRYARQAPTAWAETEPDQYAAAEEEDPFQQPDPYQQPYGYEEQHFGQHYQQQQALSAPLISPQTEAHAETAFRQLSDAILARATGDRSLEDMTREMLRTMLKQWLDSNLSAIVEDMVREEIQRVARRGR